MYFTAFLKFVRKFFLRKLANSANGVLNFIHIFSKRPDVVILKCILIQTNQGSLAEREDSVLLTSLLGTVDLFLLTSLDQLLFYNYVFFYKTSHLKRRSTVLSLPPE
jgi:hypothetical protein